MSNYSAKFVKVGNIKIGHMWSFSKLAGSGMIQGYKGTCGQYCTGCYNPNDPMRSSCYVFKSYRIYPSVIGSHINNTVAIRNDMAKAFSDLSLQIKRAKKKPETIRIHASGEIETLAELMEWNALAHGYPNINFYVYTKRFDLIDAFYKTGAELNDNFYVNISIWHENGIKCYQKWQHKDNIRAFVYVDDFDYAKAGLKIEAMCPAYTQKTTKKGKIRAVLNHDITCDKCKLCFSSKAKVTGCLDH